MSATALFTCDYCGTEFDDGIDAGTHECRVSHRLAWEGATTTLCGVPGRLRTYERPTDRPICPTCDLLASALGWQS